MKPKHRIAVWPLIILICMAFISHSHAAGALEWEIVKTFDMDAAPVDMTLSPDGKQLFVLNDKGDILIFSSGSNPIGTIHVGAHVDRIKVVPGGNFIILGSRENKSVQLMSLDFIQNISAAGSPFKGPEGAPVTVAVFNDFE